MCAGVRQMEKPRCRVRLAEQRVFQRARRCDAGTGGEEEQRDSWVMGGKVTSKVSPEEWMGGMD